MAELANCPRCDRVFVKEFRDICWDCYKQEEEAFQVVFTFLKDRKNREATVNEIMEHTKVEEELIIKFVREGRLRPSEFPNLSYPCERCGTKIVIGKYCNNCITELKRDLELHEEMQKKTEQQKKEKVNTYYAINNRNHKSL